MSFSIGSYLRVEEKACQPIFISQNVVQRLHKEKETGIEGVLYGLVGPRVLILTVIFPDGSRDDRYKKNYLLPGNYKKLGTFFTYELSRELKTSSLKPYRLVIAKDVSTGTFDIFILSLWETPADFIVIDQDFINDITMKFNIHGNLFVNRNEFFLHGQKFESMNKFVFRFRNTPWYISHQTGPLSRKTCTIFEEDKGALEFFDIDILYSRNYNGNYTAAPQLVMSREAHKLPLESMLKIEVDAICICFKDGEINYHKPLLLTLKKFLRLFRSIATMVGSAEKMVQLKSTFFFPEPLGHIVTRIYHEDEERNGSELRLELLNYFRLDLKPYFTLESSISKIIPKVIINPIINVHKGLENCHGRELTVALVAGTYAYYHFMQDDITDCGWGCAYRSLQIIFSWFRWQSYTTNYIPTHRAIQEKLVELKQKDKSFIGSNQSIGTAEVASCLESMLSISCEILNLPSGVEIKYLGRELTKHFTAHGSPVMISDDQLSHIIIGVDYGNVTGKIKFLVLDPHYVGIDDISTIQSEGAVGWKDPDFWSQDESYTLCMPLIPIIY